MHLPEYSLSIKTHESYIRLGMNLNDQRSGGDGTSDLLSLPSQLNVKTLTINKEVRDVQDFY